MRDLDTIDSELRLPAAVRRVCREQGGRVPAIGPVDELLDERPRANGKLTRLSKTPSLWSLTALFANHRVIKPAAAYAAIESGDAMPLPPQRSRDHAVVVVVSENGY